MYSIDLKKESNYKKKFLIFIHSKETMVRSDKINYPPPRHVWR
jgi:hypothetical protein